jgi:hypothetical protein
VAGEQLVEVIGVQRVREIETLGHLAAEHLCSDHAGITDMRVRPGRELTG